MSFSEFQVYDGYDQDSPLLGTYCGQIVPKQIGQPMLSKIRSTSNVIHVRFTSDGTRNGAGFVIEYSCVTGIVKLQRFTFGYFLFFIYLLVWLTNFIT